MTDYTNISIPVGLVDMVRTFIDEHPELGYKTVTEFIKEAVREKLGVMRDKRV